MLQRAASNAYSWWWASHIRTKQSKWLDVNLQEMEERVKIMLKLIEEDADSFGKRAEMYFKRRPELISIVEEAYRAYRALADRYDHISGELHKANHTIATAFPDQVQYAMLEEEDDNFPKAITPIDPGKINKPLIEGLVNKKKENRPPTRKAQKNKNTDLDKEKAQEDISKLQKGILVLQTEKEFIKSSYESGMAKYWEIEKKIMEMQEDVFFLEDEFSASAVIEDDEARALMTTTALKSCEDAIVRLQEQREKSMKNARAESERIKVAVEKLRALKGESSKPNVEPVEEVSNDNNEVITFLGDIEEEAYSLNKEKIQLHTLCEKVKEHIQTKRDASALEIAEDINELVNKMIDLELTISSQTAKIGILSSENNELEKHLQSIEEEKTILANNTDELTKRLREAEDELNKVQIIEKNVCDEEKDFRTNFTEFFSSLNDISEKMETPRLHENGHMRNPFLDEEDSSFSPEPQREREVKEVAEVHDIMENLVEETHMTEELNHFLDDRSRPEESVLPESNSCRMRETNNDFETRDKESIHANLSIQKGCNQETQPSEKDILDLQQLLLKFPEGQEKKLLSEYTSILRNYSETKKTLSEVEQNNENNLHEMSSMIRELKNAIAMKDDEIRMLRQELSLLKANRIADAACRQGIDSGDGHRRFRSMSNFQTLIDRKNIPFPKMPPKPNHKLIATRNKSIEAMDIGTSLSEGIHLKSNDELNDTLLVEDKFRMDIDALLEENLEFWLRFSTSFHHVQDFQSKFDYIQADIDKVKNKMMQEGSTSSSKDQISKAKPAPAAAELRALKTELQVWLEQSQLLRRELEARFSSLCSIQDEISGVIDVDPGNAEEKLTPYQAAKFLGEVLNMQQENNKVASELQLGQDHVRGLQTEIERELSKLYNSFEPSSMPRTNNINQFRNFPTKGRVPLRAFLFGAKQKKPSIFACMNPAFLKQHGDFRNPGSR